MSATQLARAVAKVETRRVEWGASGGAERALSSISVEEWRGDAGSAARVVAVMAEVGWGRYPGTPDEYAAAFRAESQRSGKRVFLAKAGPAVVGFAELYLRASQTWAIGEGDAYLLAVAVSPRHARSGLARALVERVLQELPARGFQRLLTDVRWDNTASIRMAESVGARLLGPSPEAVRAVTGGQPHLRYELELGRR